MFAAKVHWLSIPPMWPSTKPRHQNLAGVSPHAVRGGTIRPSISLKRTSTLPAPTLLASSVTLAVAA